VKRLGYVGCSCKKPIFCLIRRDSFQQSNPNTVAVPVSALRNPSRMWIVVVFPAPLGPMKPEIPPPSLRFNPFNAVILPKRLVRLSVTIIGFNADARFWCVPQNTYTSC